jgi:hypothetical protein
MRNLGKKLRLLAKGLDGNYSLYVLGTLITLAEEAEHEEKSFPPEPVQEKLIPLPESLTGNWDADDEDAFVNLCHCDDDNWPNPPDDDPMNFFDGTPRWREE